MENKIVKKIPSINEIRSFRRAVVRWFSKNKQFYPWRDTKDPFKVLIAEIMLRRTKANQVKAVYNQLFERYPNIESLLMANDAEVQKILYHLGLRWRLPAITQVAQELKEKFNHNFPTTREELKTLTGVGEYVAGAVLSIAYNKREWIIDSNIVRLFKRYFGIKTSKEGRRDTHIIEIAKIYVSEGNPKQNNLALLDFAALICSPQKPKCHSCTLNNTCHDYSLVTKKYN